MCLAPGRGLFRSLCECFSVNDVTQIDAVQQVSGLVAHLKHERPGAAIFFLDAVFACFMRVTAGTGHQGQRTAHDADEIAIANVDGCNAQPISAVLAALRCDEPRTCQFGQDHGQEFGRNLLCLGNIGELHRPFAEMVRQMLHGADGVAGFLGQHALLLRRMACFFNPASRQSDNSLNFVPKF